MNLLGNKSVPTKSSSWFGTKSGKLGAVVLGLMAIGVAFGLKAAAPWIAELAKDLWRAAFYGGSLLIVGFVLTRPKVRWMIADGFRTLMALATNEYVRRNFMEIMRNHIDRGIEKLGDIRTEIKSLSGTKQIVVSELDTVKKEIESDMSMSKKAKENGLNATNDDDRRKWKREYDTINARIGTNADSAKSFEIEKKRLEMMLKVLKKIEDYTQTFVDRLDHKVKAQIRKYKTISAAHRAFTQAWSTVYGDNISKEFFDKSMELIDVKMSEKSGDIDVMMDDFKKLMMQQDLQNAVYADAGEKAMLEWENKHKDKLENEDFSFIDNIDNVDQLLRSMDGNVPTPVAIPAAAKTSDVAASSATEGKYLS